MTPEEAYKIVNSKFPFKGYMEKKSYNEYITIGKIVQKYLKPGSIILDFGAGPCDNTAIIQSLGYKCFAADDLQDSWHKNSEAKEKILKFAASFNIDFAVLDSFELPYKENMFDMIMMHDVIEHFHSSPKELINKFNQLLKPQGYLFISTPNIISLYKRAKVFMGKTNMCDYEIFYNFPGEWRSHVREYSKQDLIEMAKLSGFELKEVHGFDTSELIKLPRFLKLIFKISSKLNSNFYDSILLVARKPK